MFYDEFAKLCSANNISRTKACIDCGVSRTAWHKWKDGATPNGTTINKFAAYFGVSVDYLLGNEQKDSAPTLTEKDRRDIARDLEDIMAHLETSGDLMFYGDPMSDEARESIRAAMKLGLEAAKVKNKERFTPKKYRKG